MTVLKRLGFLFASLCLVLCLVGRVAADSLPDSEIQALNAWPNWVSGFANQCSGSPSTISVPAGTLASFIPEPYNGAFTQGANNHNVAPALIAALFSEEHNLGGNETNPDTSSLARAWASFVKNHPDPNSGWNTSSAGAQGPFQFEPATFTGLGYNLSDINNLVVSADAAGKYAQTDGATKDKPEASWKSFIFSYNHADWYVNAVLQYYDYYNAQAGAPAGGAPTTVTVSGGCNAAVDCSSAASATSLSQTRQQAVCIAQGELQKWTSGQLKPANGFLTYSQGNYEEWCADFVSWVYDQAHYPVQPDPNWRESSVSGLQAIGEKNQSFHWHSVNSGYVPKPGDLAIHGGSHVNMVVSVKGTTVTLIGGDQSNPAVGVNNYGTKDPPSTSIVSTETVTSYSGDGITGYVSPD
ncbi:MAG TPA: CHAP domain-containing protein [Patescibacteria group bacterium]|nr:CHAP domain-containing protein [Patescibacteria group bacterium]